jgi:hypothetical protein
MMAVMRAAELVGSSCGTKRLGSVKLHTWTRMPATAVMAVREWISSDSLYHLSASGLAPRPRGGFDVTSCKAELLTREQALTQWVPPEVTGQCAVQVRGRSGARQPQWARGHGPFGTTVHSRQAEATAGL